MTAGRYNPLGGNAIIPCKAPRKNVKKRVGSSALLESHGDPNRPNGSAAARDAGDTRNGGTEAGNLLGGKSEVGVRASGLVVDQGVGPARREHLPD